MFRTPSQLADSVLEKVALTWDEYRMLSNREMARRGVRGGAGVNSDLGEGLLARNPVSKKGFRALGPMVIPDTSIIGPGGKKTPIPLGPQILDADPEKLLYEPGSPTFTGGRGGSLNQALSHISKTNKNIVLPQTPLGKEMTNRLGPIHEGFEQEALGKGMTHAQRARGWGKPNMPSKVREVGSIGTHFSPQVILRENNLMSTLGVPARQRQHLVPPGYNPNPALADEVRNSVTSLRTRSADNSWDIINRSTGGRLPEYGTQRLSRHAIRRIQENMQKGLPGVWPAPRPVISPNFMNTLRLKLKPKLLMPPQWQSGKMPPALGKIPSPPKKTIGGLLSKIPRFAKAILTRGRSF